MKKKKKRGRGRPAGEPTTNKTIRLPNRLLRRMSRRRTITAIVIEALELYFAREDRRKAKSRR